MTSKPYTLVTYWLTLNLVICPEQHALLGWKNPSMGCNITLVLSQVLSEVFGVVFHMMLLSYKHPFHLKIKPVANKQHPFCCFYAHTEIQYDPRTLKCSNFNNCCFLMQGKKISVNPSKSRFLSLELRPRFNASTWIYLDWKCNGINLFFNLNSK